MKKISRKKMELIEGIVHLAGYKKDLQILKSHKSLVSTKLIESTEDLIYFSKLNIDGRRMK